VKLHQDGALADRVGSPAGSGIFNVRHNIIPAVPIAAIIAGIFKSLFSVGSPDAVAGRVIKLLCAGTAKAQQHFVPAGAHIRWLWIFRFWQGMGDLRQLGEGVEDLHGFFLSVNLLWKWKKAVSSQ